MDKKPGDNFKEEAKPFLEEIREQAVQAYQHMVRISKDLGLRMQKTLDNVPGLGIGGNTRSRPSQDNHNDSPTDDQDS